MKKKPYLLIINILVVALSLCLLPTGAYSQWQKVTNLPSGYQNNYWLEISFLKGDNRFGWICGQNGLTLRTTDGGNTWLGSSIGRIVQLESINFPSRFVGYTSGAGQLFKSTDGGASWFDITPPTTNYELWGNYFITDNYGIVVGGGCGSEQGFFRTTDGGGSWTEFYANEPNSGMSDVQLDNISGGGFAVSSGLIWITQNGGRTWQVFAKSGDNDWQEDLWHVGNTFLVPYSPPCYGGGPGGARISTDNGRSWSQFSTGQAMFGAFLHDDKRGWVCGWGKTVYYTPDGGKTWLLKNCGIENNDSLDDFWFINDTLGWVIGSHIYKYVSLEKNPPVITSNGPTSFCEGDSVILTVTREFKYYCWSTGERTRSILVRKPGSYSVQAWNTECDSATSNTIVVSINPSPRPVIQAAKTRFCVGDSVLLSVPASQYRAFTWSTGETSPVIMVKTSGTYSVTVTDTTGCTGTSSISVEAVPNPTPEITVEGSSSPCVGDSALLTVPPGYSTYEWYEDPNPDPVQKGGNKYYVKHSGTYYAVVTNDLGCVGKTRPVTIGLRNDTNKIEITVEMSEGAFRYDSASYPHVLCRGVTIRNVSSKPVTIDDALLVRNTAFSIPQSQFSIVLQPGESKDLVVCYSPTELGMQSDTLVLNDVCSPHNLKLIAYGKANIYSGGSLCEVPVQFITKSINDKYSLSVSAPFPNPSVIKVNLPYDKVYSSDGNYQEECVLYNSMGKICARSDRVVDSQVLKGNKVHETGEFVFNVGDLEQGAYFIVVSAGDDHASFPVVISR